MLTCVSPERHQWLRVLCWCFCLLCCVVEDACVYELCWYVVVYEWMVISCYHDVWSGYMLIANCGCVLCDNRPFYEILWCFMFDKKCVLCLPIMSIHVAYNYFGKSCSCGLHLWQSEPYLWPSDIMEWAAFMLVRRLIKLWCF